MTTPVYGYPSPTLATAADGPAAVSNLALRVEREQTVLRGVTTNSKEVQIVVGAGNSYAVHTYDCAVSTIGWIDVELNIIFGVADENAAAYPNISGTVTLMIGGNVIRTVRFHNVSRTRIIDKTISGRKALIAANTTVNIQGQLAIDGNSAPVTYYMSQLNMRQFGAPST